MYFVVPQPTMYRPTFCGRSRRPYYARPSHHYWHHPLTTWDEPSITWVIQRPSDINQPGEETTTTAHHDNTKQDEHRTASSHSNVAAGKNEPFSVQVKLPDGIAANNVQVQVHNNVLIVTAEKRAVSDNFVSTTSFARQFPVASDVDTDRISAVINPDGVLVVTAPRKGLQSEAALPSPEPTTTTETTTATTNTESKPEEEILVPTESTSTTASSEVAATQTQTQLQTQTQAVAETKPVERDQSEDVPVLVPFKLRVSQNDDAAFVVTIDLPPGVSANDLNLQVNRRVLSVSGEQHKDYKGAALTSKFVRHFTLDKNAELDNISAKLDDATRVLTVTVPKKQPATPKVHKIAIQVASSAAADSAPTLSPTSSATTTTPTTTEEAKEEREEEVSVSTSTAPSTTPAEGTLADNKSADSANSSKDESWTEVETVDEDESTVHVTNK